MNRWIASALVVTALLALAVVLWETSAGPADSADGTELVPGADPSVDSPLPGQAAQRGSSYRPRHHGPPPEASRPEPEPYSVSLDSEASLTAWSNAQEDAVKRAHPHEIDEREARARSGDADSAYWMYQYKETCRTRPQSSWHLDRELRTAEELLDGRHPRSPAHDNPDLLSDLLDQVEQEYALCVAAGPEFDFTSAALEWLELAADMGHMGAQRLYHSKARKLLMTPYAPLAFEQPELIGEFKLRADTYARALLRSGHPQGLLMMARMLKVGDVYEQDLVMAYAYAHAAVLSSRGGTLSDARRMRAWVAESLPPDAIPEAERLAQDLLVEE